MSKSIPLTRGFIALVDDEDFDKLAEWKWYARSPKAGKATYAIRTCHFNVTKSCAIAMHRSILGLEPFDKRQVDHVNGIGTDNRKINLRIVEPMQNTWNRPRYCNNSSGFKGVSFNKAEQKFRAYICAKGKQYHLGFFDDPAIAHEAYKVASQRLHGEFGRAA